MTDERAILSYARPRDAGDADSGASVFTFASPDARAQKVLLLIVLLVCGIGAVVVIGLAIAAGAEQRDDWIGTLIGAVVALAFMLGVTFYARREFVRLQRFGQLDVRLEVSGDKLLAWAPQAWGGEPREVDVEDITSVSAHSAGHVVGAVPVYQIHIRRHGWLTTYWAIRVACADRGVIDRSIADLNRAIERAKALADSQPIGSQQSGRVS